MISRRRPTLRPGRAGGRDGQGRRLAGHRLPGRRRLGGGDPGVVHVGPGTARDRGAAQPVRRSSSPPAGLTVLVEIVYPANRIVLDYAGLDDLILLGAVEIATGRTFGPARGAAVARAGGGLVRVRDAGRGARRAAAGRPRGTGRALPDTDERVKIKYAEYVRLHRLVTGLSARTVWEVLVAGGDLDALTRAAARRVPRVGPRRGDRADGRGRRRAAAVVEAAVRGDRGGAAGRLGPRASSPPRRVRSEQPRRAVPAPRRQGLPSRPVAAGPPGRRRHAARDQGDARNDQTADHPGAARLRQDHLRPQAAAAASSGSTATTCGGCCTGSGSSPSGRRAR